eukprot:4584242-Amphidinium_carterae.1
MWITCAYVKITTFRERRLVLELKTALDIATWFGWLQVVPFDAIMGLTYFKSCTKDEHTAFQKDVADDNQAVQLIALAINTLERWEDCLPFKQRSPTKLVYMHAVIFTLFVTSGLVPFGIQKL